MRDIIAVGGPGRSGTSMVAAVLQAMGVPMCDALFAPVPGGHVQYEDRDFAMKSMTAAMQHRMLSREYIRRWMLLREQAYRELAESYDVAGAWGVKAPPLTLFRREFDEVARELGHRVLWITCHRPVRDSMNAQKRWADRWMKRTAKARVATEINVLVDRRIRDAIPMRDVACHVEFNTWHRDPVGLATLLCDSLGLSHNRIAAGAAAVTTPRST